MATTVQTTTGSLPSAFEPFYTTGATGATGTQYKGLIPQAFDLYGKGTAADFAKKYATPLQEAGLYGAGRIAGLSPELKTVQTGLAGLTTPNQFTLATNAIGKGVTELGAALTPVYQNVVAPGLASYSMAKPSDVTTSAFTTPSMGTAKTTYDPDLQQYQINPLGQQIAPTMGIAQTAFDPNLQRFQMETPEQFSGEQIERYMSPYMQNVVEAQKREAIRDAQKTQLGANLAAARQGTYGGARQLLAQTERERALGTQLGDIQAKGLQAAYDQAGTQFERDRTAQMAAQQANLQAALGVQQLGTQTGLQAALANLSAEQQANVQNQAAQLQTQGLNAQQAMQVALANQQAALGTQQLGTQTGLQTALANLSSEQQANVQNLAAKLQTQGLNADQALRAALANQQTGLAVGQQDLAAQLAMQQLYSGQKMEAQRANQAAALQAAQLQQQAAMGLGTLGAQYGQLGIGQQAAALDRLKALGAFGDLTRGIEQQKLDTQYADLMRGIYFPETQLESLSGFLRGIPMTDSTTNTTTPPPSFASQLAGLGLSGLSLYNLLGGQK